MPGMPNVNSTLSKLSSEVQLVSSKAQYYYDGLQEANQRKEVLSADLDDSIERLNVRERRIKELTEERNELAQKVQQLTLRNKQLGSEKKAAPLVAQRDRPSTQDSDPPPISLVAHQPQITVAEQRAAVLQRSVPGFSVLKPDHEDYRHIWDRPNLQERAENLQRLKQSVRGINLSLRYDFTPKHEYRLIPIKITGDEDALWYESTREAEAELEVVDSVESPDHSEIDPVGGDESGPDHAVFERPRPKPALLRVPTRHIEMEQPVISQHQGLLETFCATRSPQATSRGSSQNGHRETNDGYFQPSDPRRDDLNRSFRKQYSKKRHNEDPDGASFRRKSVCINCWRSRELCDFQPQCLPCKRLGLRCKRHLCSLGLGCRNPRCPCLHPGEWDESDPAWNVEEGNMPFGQKGTRPKRGDMYRPGDD